MFPSGNFLEAAGIAANEQFPCGDHGILTRVFVHQFFKVPADPFVVIHAPF